MKMKQTDNQAPEPKIYKKQPTGPYYVRKQSNGKRRSWCTGSRNRNEAMTLAKAWLKSVEQERTEVLRQVTRRRDCATVEEAINAFLTSGFRKCSMETAKDYVRSLRVMLRETGHGEVEPLTVLTPDLVRQFYAQRLEGLDGADKLRAATTANTHFRSARSIFGKGSIKRGVFGDLNLPEDVLTEFKSADMEEEGEICYELPDPEIMRAIMADAPRMKQEDKAVYACFLLVVSTGMRKSEAARLRWGDITRVNGQLVALIQPREAMTKNKRGRRVPIHENVVDELSDIASQSAYYRTHVIPGSDNDRTERVWRRMAYWFRSHGWDREKAAHEMRKFYGAQVATQQGLYAAQKLLGHSNPQVTNQYYATLVDLKEPTLMLPPTVEEQPRIEGGDQ